MSGPQSKDPSAPTAPVRRVLLVEDNEFAGKGLAKLLEARGFAVTTVADGRSALLALGTEPPPDFLLTDVQLPDLDGREIARFSRRLAFPPRVALLTGWDIEIDPPERAELGISWILTKPIDIHELISRLNEECQTGRNSD
jgi:DNA-binding response OmpR family regulator